MSTITTPTLAGPVVNASDLIAETENHWNVSGTSVLVAWIITAAGGVGYRFLSCLFASAPGAVLCVLEHH